MISRPSNNIRDIAGNHLPIIEKDPCFDGIRETAELVALMEKYR